MFLNNNKTKDELISHYNINKAWLDMYEPFYTTYIERLKRNEQLAEELYNRFGYSFDGITPPQDNDISKATREQKLESALQFINDITYDYDGCNTVDSLKGLIDEIRDRINKVFE